MVQRITGLASGMDVDSIISKMIQAKRVPIDKLVQKRQTLQWQRESYRDLNTKMLDFRNNKMGNYRMATTYNATKVTVSGDTAAISAKVTGSVTGTSMSVKVDKLGSAATNFSDSVVSLDGIDEKGGAASVQAGITFKVNGKEITTVEGDTLNSVLSKISRETNVSAFYDEKSKRVSFAAKNTGNMDNITGYDVNLKPITQKVDKIQFEGAFLTDVLHVNTNSGTAGQQATVYVNGMEYHPDSSVLTVNGVEITLLKESQGAGSTLSMSTDTDKLVDTIKAFVSDYNEMLSTLNGIVNEKRYRDYAPLTEDQKKEMKDTQIEQWEKKAKSGLLYSDSILSSAVRSMRYAVMSKVDLGTDNKYTSLSSIGITTGAYQENGKLYLDEAKLRKAIEADPDAVKNLFSSKGTPKLDAGGNEVKDSAGNTVLENVGIAEQLYKSFNTAQKDIMKKIGYASIEDSSAKDESIIGKQIYNLSKEITTGEKRLTDLETRYYKQFAAMETAVNKANSQSSALSRAFS